MKMQRFDSIWDAIGRTPQDRQYESARSDDVGDSRRGRGVEHDAAGSGKELGLTQPRMNDLLRGRISKFSLDALINIASRAGLAAKIEVGPAGS
jgi:predicted XRE-type DNA-binding protein